MILVVGGAGYIGSHMVRLLREQGEDCVVLDNLESGHEQAISETPLVRADLRDLDQVRKALSAHDNVDVVMNFGASISVGESVRDPEKYYRNNVVGTLNLLTAMKERGLDKFVFSSTAAVYGEPQQVPIPEDHPKNPTSPYGTSKWMMENIVADFGRAFGLRSVIFRYFNAAGAHPDASIGEDHQPEEHLIPVAIEALLGKRPSLKVFGTDYPTPDGTCVRDYIHVCDLASAHLKGVDRLRRGGDSAVYNLGNGQGFSVKQVMDTVSSVVGRPVPFSFDERRPGDPAILIASSDKARAELDWRPERPDLETIIEDAWRWHSTHPEGYA